MSGFAYLLLSLQVDVLFLLIDTPLPVQFYEMLRAICYEYLDNLPDWEVMPPAQQISTFELFFV